MKNYSSKYIPPSKKYYLNQLKNKSKKLSINQKSNSLIDHHLDSFLVYSYNFFQPFFGEEEKQNQYSRKAYNSYKHIDNDFDMMIEHYTPSFLKQLLLIIIKLYNKLVNKQLIRPLKNIISYVNKQSIKSMFKNVIVKKKNITINSPP